MKDLAGLTKLICLCFKLSPITSFEPKNTYTSPHVSQKPPLSHVNLLLTINFGHVRDPFQGKDAGCKISRLVFFFFLKKKIAVHGWVLFFGGVVRLLLRASSRT